MTKPRGKNIPISPFRGLVIDLMHFTQKVPSVSIDRRMNLAVLAEARSRCFPKPTWTALFIKAYSIVAARDPALRQSYMEFPWPRIYEHPKNIVTLNVSRNVNGENVVLQDQIRSPENRSLPDLDARVRRCKEAPVEEINAYKRVMAVSWLPRFLRRSTIWSTLNIFGRRRCHNMGTFAITSVADRGAGVLNVATVLTTMIHYGLFDDEACLDMRMAFDHRVLDGAQAADALTGMEHALLNEVLHEVRGLAARPSQFPLPLAA
jgi:hypothetical protein